MGRAEPGQQPLPPPPQGQWRASAAGRAVRVPCAPHLRTAPCVTVSAGDSLEGVTLFNHYTQPSSAAPHKMAAPMDPAAAAPPAPFCARREICQHGIPPPRMHLTGEARRQGTEPAGTALHDVGDCPAPSGAPSSSVFSGRSLRGRAPHGKGSGRQRRAAAGRSGDWRRGDSGPGSGGLRTGGPLSSSVSRPVALVRARRWPRRLRLRERGVAMPAVAAQATRQTCFAAAGTVGTEAAPSPDI